MKMPGLAAVYEKSEYLRMQRAIEELLKSEAVEQKIASRREAVVVRDLLPRTDFSWAKEAWWYDLSGGTVNEYNQVVNVDLDKKKIIAIWGVKMRGDPVVSAVKFMRGESETIDIWEIEALGEGEISIITNVEDVVLYHAQDKVNIQYYLLAQGYPQFVLLGKVAEKRDTTVAGSRLKEDEVKLLHREMFRRE